MLKLLPAAIPETESSATIYVNQYHPGVHKVTMLQGERPFSGGGVQTAMVVLIPFPKTSVECCVCAMLCYRFSPCSIVFYYVP